MSLFGLPIPFGVLTDSYKAGHPFQYPEARRMVAYGEFRKPFEGSKEDRFIFYGIRYLVENFLSYKWTMEDIEKLDKFYSTHNAGGTHYPWPKDLFEKIVKEKNGYFPVKIEALPEGTAAYIHTPVYQITAEGEFSRLVTFLETMLTWVWYGTSVATLSRRAKDIIEAAFVKTVDDSMLPLLDSRLHDFGFRGCTTLEQSVVGGCAHLINFAGSDTMSAAYYAQFHLNNGKPVASSVPATEHSVMTSWRTEKEAIENMIDKFGAGPFSCVMDSYDYANALNNILPQISVKKVNKGGFMVLRPDSGDPVEAVLMGLRAAEKVFGADVNSKGYKVIRGAGVLQGDGINIDTLNKILEAALAEKYSAASIIFGMGGGLLQKVNRDTMSFATKLSYIEYADGSKRDTMKFPQTDGGKISLPGVLKVVKVDGVPTVFPGDPNQTDPNNVLRVVYDSGPVPGVWDDFDTIRKRADTEWHALPRGGHPISKELQVKIDAWVQAKRAELAASQAH